MTNTLRVIPWAIICVVLLTLPLRGEMSIEEEDPPFGPFARKNDKYDRFTNHFNFYGLGYDWSGVGREIEPNGSVLDPTIDRASRWGTLVSASFFITAAHHMPRTQHAMVFFRNNDRASSERRGVDSVWYLFDPDIWGHPPDSRRDGAMGKLESPLSDSIATYPIYLAADYSGTEMLTFGVSGASYVDPAGQKVGWQKITSEDAHGWRKGYWRFESGVNPVEQALARPHDSGASGFLEVSFGRPSLVATHWTGVGGTAGDGAVDLSPISASMSIVGWYKWEIEDEMNQRQLDIVEHLRERAIFWTGMWGDVNGSFALEQDDLDIMLRDVYARTIGMKRGYNWALDFDQLDGGITSHDSDMLVQSIFLTQYGDANLDRKVSQPDLDVVLTNWGRPAGWAQGDFNGDGKVSQWDLDVVLMNWGSDTNGGNDSVTQAEDNGGGAYDSRHDRSSAPVPATPRRSRWRRR